MKIKQLFFILSIVSGTVLLFACKKDSDPTNSPEDTDVVLLTKVYSSMLDTSGPALNSDSIYYNTKNQIVKVVHTPGSEVYNFSYNDDGDLLTVNILSSNEYGGQTYKLYYNNKKTLDSLIIIELGTPVTIRSTMNYDMAGGLTNVLTDYLMQGTGDRWFQTTYFRSSKLDSIHSDFIYQNKRINSHFSAGTSTVNKPVIIDKAYLFMMAIRMDKYLFISDGNNIYLQQFLNPKDNLMSNGELAIYDLSDSSSIHTFNEVENIFTFNSDSTLRTYQYAEIVNGKSYGRSAYKFDYTIR